MTNPRFTRRQFLDTTLLVAASTMVPFSAFAETPKRGGTLVLGTTQIPRHVNGGIQPGGATAMPSTQVFASPLRFDDEWNPQPYLAETWEMAEDGTSLTLNLRKNAVFHDGEPITSADVAFSVMAIKANHPFQTMMAPVTGVDTPDAHTAIIRTSKPHPALLLCMSPALCPILPKHIYDDGTDLKLNPRNAQGVVGSGPFKLVEFDPSQRIVLERFDDFFLSGKPYLDKVIIAINPDAASLILSLERGDINMMPFVSIPTDLRRLSNVDHLTMTSKGYESFGALNWLEFNLTREPMSDPQVRKAIATAIDKDFITKALMGGFAEVSDGPLVPSSPFSAGDDLVRYPFDLEKAAAMLDEAGYKTDANGERFTLSFLYQPGNDDQQKTVAEYIKGQLKKIGITAELKSSADFPSWAESMATHDFDIAMDIVANWADPVIGVARTYMSTNIKPIVWTNTTSYINPAVDKLLEDAGSTLDPVKRKADYVAFQKIVTDELPIEYINVVPYHTVSSNNVGNVPTSIWGPMSPYDEVYLK